MPPAIGPADPASLCIGKSKQTAKQLPVQAFAARASCFAACWGVGESSHRVNAASTSAEARQLLSRTICGFDRVARSRPYNARMSEGEQTVFDRILSGEIPSHRVYEDEHVYAFLDIGPLSRGHTLVIPRERAKVLHELSDEASAAIGRVLPRLCRAIMQASGASAYNVLQNNGSEAHQAVFHVHFHIIPKFTGEASAGLDIEWKPGQLDADEAKSLQEVINSALEEGPA